MSILCNVSCWLISYHIPKSIKYILYHIMLQHIIDRHLLYLCIFLVGRRRLWCCTDGKRRACSFTYLKISLVELDLKRSEWPNSRYKLGKVMSQTSFEFSSTWPNTKIESFLRPDSVYPPYIQSLWASPRCTGAYLTIGPRSRDYFRLWREEVGGSHRIKIRIYCTAPAYLFILIRIVSVS